LRTFPRIKKRKGTESHSIIILRDAFSGQEGKYKEETMSSHSPSPSPSVPLILLYVYISVGELGLELELVVEDDGDDDEPGSLSSPSNFTDLSLTLTLMRRRLSPPPLTLLTFSSHFTHSNLRSRLSPASLSSSWDGRRNKQGLMPDTQQTNKMKITSLLLSRTGRRIG
jgi:hypothetical protein